MNGMKLLVGMVMMMLAACSPKIYGTVQLVDANMQPVPVVTEEPQGTVINMINTSVNLEQASHAVTVDKEGKFESMKDRVTPGMYKVEASRIGYMTDTQSIEIKAHTRQKLEIKLKKIQEGKRKTIGGAKTDEDKIINPGEVNIQPPTM